MIAFIGSGYGSTASSYANSTATYYPSGYASDTATYYIDAYMASPIHSHLYDPYLMDVMPWIFKLLHPWMSPVHYPPAPRKMSPKRISGTYHKPLIVKQPRARSGFKRGQRR